MMRKVLLYISLLVMSCSETAFAQTVQWAIRPTTAQIEGYGQLLKVKRNGKCGLIDHNSQVIVPISYDSISPFRDGYAIAMNVRGNQMKIEAVISENDYEVQSLTENVYATRYLWFSDGKMPVKGSSGWGYLGTDGNMTIPCQFQVAYPFSEGFASVTIDDKAYYIDRNMDYLPVEAGYGNLVFASTFTGDEAVVYSGNSYTPKGYVINRRGRIIRNYKVKPDDLKVNKYDHSVGDKVAQYKEHVQQLQLNDSYTVFQENGRFGYKKDGVLVLPAQLEKADPVRGQFANVRFKGQNGVLRMVDGKFSLQIENNVIDVIDEQAGKGYLRLNLPISLVDANVTLRMIDSRGSEMFIQSNVAQGEQRSYSFKPLRVPTNSCSETYMLEVWNDNLLLWTNKCNIDYRVSFTPKNDELTATEKPEETRVKKDLTIASLTISPPKAKSKRAGPKNDFLVKVTVSNSGDKRGTGSVTLFVDGQQVGVKTIGVRGHGQADAVFSVGGIRKERYAKVKAMLKNGHMSHEANIHFMPFN